MQKGDRVIACAGDNFGKAGTVETVADRTVGRKLYQLCKVQFDDGTLDNGRFQGDYRPETSFVRPPPDTVRIAIAQLDLLRGQLVGASADEVLQTMKDLQAIVGDE